MNQRVVRSYKGDIDDIVFIRNLLKTPPFGKGGLGGIL